MTYTPSNLGTQHQLDAMRYADLLRQTPTPLPQNRPQQVDAQLREQLREIRELRDEVRVLRTRVDWLYIQVDQMPNAYQQAHIEEFQGRPLAADLLRGAARLMQDTPRYDDGYVRHYDWRDGVARFTPERTTITEHTPALPWSKKQVTL